MSTKQSDIETSVARAIAKARELEAGQIAGWYVDDESGEVLDAEHNYVCDTSDSGAENFIVHARNTLKFMLDILEHAHEMAQYSGGGASMYAQQVSHDRSVRMQRLLEAWAKEVNRDYHREGHREGEGDTETARTIPPPRLRSRQARMGRCGGCCWSTKASD